MGRRAVADHSVHAEGGGTEPIERFLRAASLGAGLVVTLILLFHAVRPVYAFRPPPGSPEPVFKAYLDRAAPMTLKHFGVPGLVITTVVRGEPSRTYAYGFADRERRKPMAPDTVFRVASISKSLTAWGILRLVEAGNVDLDAPVRRYLGAWPLPKSGFPTSGVTLRRLLNHTSGLNAGADIFRRPQERILSAWELLSREGDGPTAGPAHMASRPGEVFRYSVPGYTILSLVIEQESHEPFQAFMKSEVLEPLGMTSSSFDWDPPLRGRTATPYLADGKPSPVMVPQDLAADALFSTGPDLGRYLSAPLPGNEALSSAALPTRLVGRISASRDQLPRIQLDGLRFDGPGLGRFIERLPDGRVAVTNGGYDPGWSSQFYLIPSAGEGIVVLTNSEVGEPVIAEILADWASWRGLPQTKMSRAHYALRLDVALVLGILVMISLYFGSDVIIEVGAGSRRFGGLGGRALIGGACETVLAVGLLWLWILVRGPIEMAMPSFYGFGAFATALFAFVTAARLVFPRGPHRGAYAVAPEPIAEAAGGTASPRPGALIAP
jgi:CubicO group peptidase (beta-lactamase class C family)